MRDVKAWAGNNNLMLNGDKTELIHITSQFRKRNESVTLNIDGAVINATKSARDLGVIVDDSLAVAAPGFKKWGGKKGATIDYGGANMCA